MATVHFSSMPNVAMPRTKMGVNFTHPTTFNHGKVFPIFSYFVQPGDSFNLDLSALIRLSTPTRPIFGNIEFKAHSFFVPMRLIYDHTPEFFGENTESAGPVTQEYTIPAHEYGINDKTTAKVMGLSHYLGKPLKDSGGYISSGSGPLVSVLQERAYWTIINEYYRRQQLQNPIIVDKSDEGYIRVDDYTISGGSKVLQTLFNRDCWTTSKKDDYFTSATVAPQYSADPVTLPLGDYAPLSFAFDDGGAGALDMVKGAFSLNSNGDVAGFDVSGYGLPIKFGKNVSSSDIPSDYNLVNSSATYFSNGRLGVVEAVHDSNISNITDKQFTTNLVANLREATAANVNEIRLAFATQRFLERDNFGTRYPEIIKSHFGVTSSLSILQRPQLLYKASQWINIQQVLSTNGASGGELGAPGANSVTAFKASIIHNAFDEFGFIMILCETKFNRLYSQGINKFDLKRTKFDFYFPEFATIGDQAILQAEIFAQKPNSGVSNYKYDDVFGYQEAWAEYRYIPDRVSGLFDPQAGSSSYNMWTLTDEFLTPEVNGINSSFILENRAPLYRALVTGETGPDYLGDFAITGTMIRTMPLYSIPGLVDHVGGR